jgi:hypothetical protein
MSITIGSFSFKTLTAQPFGYAETDTQAGLTARKWRISGLCTPAQWQSLLTVYTVWRNDRKEDEDSLLSRNIGTTVALTAKANGITWTSVACWFLSAPSGEQAGPYISVEAEVVDAVEALEVLLIQEEKNQQRNDALLPDLGTVTVGTTVIKLLRPMETFDDNPQVALTAGGSHYISGPLQASQVRDIEGTTSATGWTNLLAWYDAIARTTPVRASYYPVSPPTATAEAVLEQGVKSTIYTVNLRLVLIR